MTFSAAKEVIKIINALPDGVKNTDQDFTDSEIYFTEGPGVKFEDKVNKNMFSLVFVVEVSTTVGVVVGSTVTGGTSGATGVVEGFSGTFLFLSSITSAFIGGEAISDGASYNTSIVQISGTGISGGKASVLCTRTTTAQFSLKGGKQFYASYEGFSDTDPDYSLKHAIALLDLTGDKKVFIEIPSNNVEVQAINTDQNGLNIGSIKAELTYPAHPNYIPLWEVTAGNWQSATDLRERFLLTGKNMQLNNYDGDLTANNATFNTLTVNNTSNLNGDVFINGDDIDQYIQTVTSGGGSQSRDVELGEDVIAGDEFGSVYFGEGVVSTKLVTQTIGGSDQKVGDVDATSRIGLIFTTPIVEDRSTRVRYIDFNVRKNGSPTDDLEFRLFESDKSTPISGFSTQTVSGTSISGTYSWKRIDLQDVQLLANTTYFLEVRRSTGLDAANYYEFQRSNTTEIDGYGYSQYQASLTTWTDSTDDLLFKIQYSEKYDVDKVWLSDSRYASTNRSDGVIVQSGLLGDIRTMVFDGTLPQTSTAIGEEYYLDTLKTENIQYPQQLIDVNALQVRDSLATFGRIASQEFVLSKDVTVDSIDLRYRSQTGLGFDVRIETDNAGQPSGTLVNPNAVATDTTGSNVATTQTFNFTSSFTLTANTNYWIVIERNPAISGGNSVVLYYSNINQTPYQLGYFNTGPNDNIRGSWVTTPGTLYYKFNFSNITPSIGQFFGNIQSSNNTTQSFDTFILGAYGTEVPEGVVPFLIGHGIEGDKIDLYASDDNWVPKTRSFMYAPGTTDVLVSLPQFVSESGTVYTKKKEFEYIARQPFLLNIRYEYRLSIGGTGRVAYAQIFVNGIPTSPERSTTFGGIWQTTTEKIEVEPGDIVQLYLRKVGGGNAEARNFEALYTRLLTKRPEIVVLKGK